MPEPNEEHLTKTGDNGTVEQDTTEVLQKIVDRNTETKTDDKGNDKTIELDKREQSKVEKKDEPKEIQITPQALKEFEELGYTKEDLEFYNADELRGILKDQRKKETKEVKQPDKPSIPIVTEEYAKTGFAKNFVGQPLTVLLEALEKQNEFIYKLQHPAKKTEETKSTQEELDEIDFLELEPKEQVEAISKIVNGAVKTALAENNKQWEEKFGSVSQAIKPVAEKEALNELFGAVQKKLPKELKADDVFNDWLKNSSLSKEAKVALGQSLEALSESVANYGILQFKKAEEEKKDLEGKKKSKLKIYEETKKKLKEADNTKLEGSEYNAASRQDGIYRDETTNEVVKKILARNS